MHSSRMRTACPLTVFLGRRADPPPPSLELNRASDTRLWKHTLRSLRYAGGNDLLSQWVLLTPSSVTTSRFLFASIIDNDLSSVATLQRLTACKSSFLYIFFLNVSRTKCRIDCENKLTLSGKYRLNFTIFNFKILLLNTTVFLLESAAYDYSIFWGIAASVQSLTYRPTSRFETSSWSRFLTFSTHCST